MTLNDPTATFLLGLFMGSTGILILQAIWPRRKSTITVSAPQPYPPRTPEQEMQYRQYVAMMANSPERGLSNEQMKETAALSNLDSMRNIYRY